MLVANLVAWVSLVGLRDPLPDSFFAERDEWLGPGAFYHSSVAPELVIAGRPLWSWNEYHGGEILAVKALEVLNLPSLIVVALCDLLVGDAFGVPTYLRSVFTFLGLLVVTTLQWLLVAKAIIAFHVWRHSREGRIA